MLNRAMANSLSMRGAVREIESGAMGQHDAPIETVSPQSHRRLVAEDRRCSNSRNAVPGVAHAPSWTHAGTGRSAADPREQRAPEINLSTADIPLT
jgi:hypothetical protein